ncbi:hypothetical protein PDJAM_G00176460, partial [Pangasius djambal]|nr:hypothetical protein [Pangasius djambal]
RDCAAFPVLTLLGLLSALVTPSLLEVFQCRCNTDKTGNLGEMVAVCGVTVWIMKLKRKTVSDVGMKSKNKLRSLVQEDTGG